MQPRIFIALALAILPMTVSLSTAQAPNPTPADIWARDTESKMTDEERFSLLHGVMPIGYDMSKLPADAVVGAGYIPGIARLGVPSLRETDASLGVTNPFGLRPGDTATAFPSTQMLAATFNPQLARQVGEVLGQEARARGFNVLLGGGANLARDPRNGRNFEYLSEDPLLTGLLAGEAIAGVQSQGVISTVKHFSLNSLETNRQTADAIIDEAAHRESDLLAFEIAIERGQPGAVMCAYNKVNGEYACGSNTLLNKILKDRWGYKGWTMSDWGAVHSWTYALAGLDQQSGEQLDPEVFFDRPLKAALASGELPRARLSDMVRRVLRSMHAVGVVNPGPPPARDPASGDALALEVARQGIVLLKNDGALPLPADAKTIAVIGGRARTGVLSGAGSSQGLPPGGWAMSVPIGGEGTMARWRVERWFPGAPANELAKLAPHAKVEFDSGAFAEDAEAFARRADVAIVFAYRHEAEGYDSPTMDLPYGQDDLIARVAKANPNTIVVLQTGNPVAMPWLGDVKAVLAAWYPGQKGGQAIAEVLTGLVNPSGRLPMTFPKSLADTPRPELPGFGTPANSSTSISYPEGADAGYRWYARNAAPPLFSFGHGLSYSQFNYSGLKITGGDNPRASFLVANSGKREGSDSPQLYLVDAAGTKLMRLVAFKRITLKPGESVRVDVEIEHRLLASYDSKKGVWQIAAGSYRFALGHSATDIALSADVTLRSRAFGR